VIVFAPAHIDSTTDVAELTASVLAPVVEQATPPPAVPSAEAVESVVALAALLLARPWVSTRRSQHIDWRRVRGPAARVDRRRGPPLSLI
jgi:hypothetical protein